jgi:hypothetical protein
MAADRRIEKREASKHSSPWCGGSGGGSAFRPSAFQEQPGDSGWSIPAGRRSRTGPCTVVHRAAL